MIRIKPSPGGKAAGSGGCTCFKLRRLTRRVTAVYDRALSAAGMRVTQYSLLSHLRGLNGVPISRLAEMLDMDRTTLTRNLRPLLEAGWLAIAPNPKDTRIRVVRITPAGDAQWQSARTYWRRAQDEVNAVIGAANVAGLHQTLDSYVPLFRPASESEGQSE